MNEEHRTLSESEWARLEAIDGRLEANITRMWELSSRVKVVEDKIDSNTQATLEGNRDAREILEIFQAVRGGLRVLGWLGTAAKWVAGIAAAVGGLWTLWNQIHKP